LADFFKLKTPSRAEGFCAGMAAEKDIITIPRQEPRDQQLSPRRTQARRPVAVKGQEQVKISDQE
jgi:hypothetical protein